MKYNLKTVAIRLWVRFHDGFLRAQKLRLAQFLHDKFPARFCWADCVSYAYGVFYFNPLKIQGCKGCKIESEQNTACYCGQWCNGRLWRDLTPTEQSEARGEAQPSSVIFEDRP